MRRLHTEFPGIVLGDHGFLPQYGSRLTPLEITGRMQFALRHGLRAIAAGERFVSDSAMEAFRNERLSPMWVRHVDLPLQLERRAINLSRAFATLRYVALREIGSALYGDPVMGPFLDSYKKAAPYTSADCGRMNLDSNAVAGLVEEMLDLKPQLVTVGGDILDFVMACDRTDLAVAFLDAVSEAADRTGACVYLCTYLGFGWPERFAPILGRTCIDGFMLTMNSDGAGMIPSQGAVRESVIQHAKPIAAMHVLLFGKLDAPTAIAQVLAEPHVRMAIVGASKPENILRLCEVNRIVARGMVI
jgi:hypothetical protein